MQSIHYANLSNGIACAPDDARYMRLQSTWCEQKRWADVLWVTPADLYMQAALGATIVVHDQSERERLTRAQWQGLSWIRYACRAAWGMPEEREKSRSGSDITAYWRRTWATLPDRVRGHVRYYASTASPFGVTINACACERIAAHKTVIQSRPLLTTSGV